MIAQMSRLPAALKNADRHAERLVQSLMNGDYALSEDEANMPSVSMLDWCSQTKKPQATATSFSASRMPGIHRLS